MEDRSPVLDGDDPPRGEGAAILGPIDLEEDRRLRVSGTQEVGVEGMGEARFLGSPGGDQRLPQHLAAEHALRAHLRAAAAEDVHLELFEIEQGNQGVELCLHGWGGSGDRGDRWLRSSTAGAEPRAGRWLRSAARAAEVRCMLAAFLEDLNVVQRHDPAATNRFETLLCHTPLHAILLHRIAHALHTRLRVPLLPRLLATLARFLTGVEIHPGARIGRRFFIDHGTGVVIGETAEVGDDCVLFHNVTLGGTGKHRGKRHPTLGDDVLVGTSATLLGPIQIGAHCKIGANSFIRMHDVPADCTAAGAPARIVKRAGRRVDEPLPRTRLSARSIPVALPGPAGGRGPAAGGRPGSSAGRET